MHGKGIEPIAISYNDTILACAEAEQSERALSVFDEMRTKGTGLDQVNYNSVLDAVCTQQPAEARKLWLEAVDSGLYANFEQVQDEHPALDLHGLSEGAAETAVRWWLECRVPLIGASAEQLVVVTGWGQSRSANQTGDIRRRVARSLVSMGRVCRHYQLTITARLLSTL